MGIAVGLHYAFSTNYLAVYDASRDYWLYNYYRQSPIWYPMEGLYGLQNTALFSSYVPGLIQWATNLPSEVFFKVYLAVFVACVPVLVYLISLKVLKNGYAIFPAIYAIGWVAFYQGASFARLNFVVLLYSLLILVLLSRMADKRKIVLSSILAALLPFAHYGGAVIGFLIIGGCVFWLILKRDWKQVVVAGVCLVSLCVSFGVWQGSINQQAWATMDLLIRDTVLMSQQGSGADVLLRDGQIVSGDGQQGDLVNPLNVVSRDRITQAAFGVADPDNAGVFKLNIWLLVFAWMTVMLMLYGGWCILSSDKKYTSAVKALTVFSFLAIAFTVLIPQVSRGYGIEKVYYQAISVTGIGLVVGAESLSKRLRLPAWWLLCAVLLPYVGLMWRFGVIPSILG